MEENVNSIEYIRNYLGGDNNDVPVYQPAVDHLEYMIDECKKCNLPLPNLFPWVGGDGVQAVWEYENNWYIEIESSSKGISELIVLNRKVNGHTDSIECSFGDIENAFRLVKIFLGVCIQIEKG